MDTVYPSPRVHMSLMNQPANMHSVVLSNHRQVILAGSWTSELRPWLKITASFQLSIYTSEASLAMHVNLLDSLNYSCHAGSIDPKTEVLTVHGISEPDCLSVERWHTCYLPMSLNLLRTQYFLPPPFLPGAVRAQARWLYWHAMTSSITAVETWVLGLLVNLLRGETRLHGARHGCMSELMKAQLRKHSGNAMCCVEMQCDDALLGWTLFLRSE